MGKFGELPTQFVYVPNPIYYNADNMAKSPEVGDYYLVITDGLSSPLPPPSATKYYRVYLSGADNSANIDEPLGNCASNSNVNPKGTDLRKVSQEELNFVMKRLNNRPRKTLNFETPEHLFNLEKPRVALVA